jgi:hypothetical protein
MPACYIEYKGGYKYQLIHDYTVKVNVHPKSDIRTDYIGLTESGQLDLKAGYAWDGPSGPTIDTATFMRGSAVHDALYQLMRSHELEKSEWRKIADQDLRRICLEDGMARIRASYVYYFVRMFGRSAASCDPRRDVHFAPPRIHEIIHTAEDALRAIPQNPNSSPKGAD